MTPVVANLLIANIAVFVLQAAMPGITREFAYIPVLFPQQPWTIVTAMFLHGDGMHLFFNMLGLYFFGSAVESRLGPKRFAILYFVSGIAGAALSTISPFTAIIGASGGVFGVMLAFARFWPDTPIYIWGVFPVPARILVIGTTVMTLYSGLTGANDGIAHFAHLGGYLGAWMYLRAIDRKAGEFKRKASKPDAKTASRLDRWEAIDLTRIHEANRDEVKRLMDKARKGGIRSLTPAEQTYLLMFVPSETTQA
jgi:membrane associated rhomboid family serine protease